MEKDVIKIDNNLIYIQNILSVKTASDEIVECEMMQGSLKIFGDNLEVLKFDMFNKTMLLSGMFYNLNY